MEQIVIAGVHWLNLLVSSFFQGSQSSQDEKAVSAITAVQMDDEVGGKAVQVGVTYTAAR